MVQRLSNRTAFHAPRRRWQDPAKVYADAIEALAAAVEKQSSKVREAQLALSEAGSESGGAAEKRSEELSTNVAQEYLLLGKQQAAAAAVAEAGPAAGVDKLLELAGDALAEALDKRLGATVTDPAIYRTHAAKWVPGRDSPAPSLLRLLPSGTAEGTRAAACLPACLLRPLARATCARSRGRPPPGPPLLACVGLPMHAHPCCAFPAAAGMRPSSWRTCRRWAAAHPPC